MKESHAFWLVIGTLLLLSMINTRGCMNRLYHVHSAAEAPKD